MPETSRNTLVYDHVALRASREAPYVLAVGHGDYFQVKFIHTDPRVFDYSVSAVSDESPKQSTTTGAAEFVMTVPTMQTAVTMRHDRHIQKYTVAITVKLGVTTTPATPRARAAPGGTTVEEAKRRAAADRLQPLYPISFDLWVRTSDWQVDFNGGFAFSNLTSDKFFIRTETKGTPPAEVKTVKRTDNGKDDFRPDIIALTNISHSDRFHGFGLAFGVGIGDNSDPRYFFGPSWVFGKNLILTGGWTGGKVNVLPVGQELDQPPISGDNTLNTLGTQFKHGFFVGVGFTFANRKDEFLGALSASTRSDAAGGNAAAGGAAPKPEEKEEEEEEVESKLLVGDYATDDGKVTFKVAMTPAGVLTLAVGNKPPVELEWTEKGTEFSIKGVSDSRVHFTVKGDKVTGLEYQVGAEKHTATRKE